MILPSDIKINGLSFQDQRRRGREVVEVYFVKKNDEMNAVARKTIEVSYSELLEHGKKKKQIVALSDDCRKIMFIHYDNASYCRKKGKLVKKPKTKWLDFNYWLTDFAPKWLFSQLMQIAITKEIEENDAIS